AWLRGIERRIAAGLKPDVRSVASIFISRWDKATLDKAPETLRDKLGIAVAKRTYAAYQEFLNSERVLRVMNQGVFPQRLLWASTGTKDPQASDILYVCSLNAPFTINTMPENTLLAFGEHGEVGDPLMKNDINPDEIIGEFEKVGFQYQELADTLQKEGAIDFVKSWNDLMTTLAQRD
ncbi:MAG: transaldolase family protein, partial [Anaerolineales bacterium]